MFAGSQTLDEFLGDEIAKQIAPLIASEIRPTDRAGWSRAAVLRAITTGKPRSNGWPLQPLASSPRSVPHRTRRGNCSVFWSSGWSNVCTCSRHRRRGPPCAAPGTGGETRTIRRALSLRPGHDLVARPRLGRAVTRAVVRRAPPRRCHQPADGVGRVREHTCRLWLHRRHS